ncbi:MAG: Rrf2 family transcriptional regulator [Planctomycetota bacterium]
MNAQLTIAFHILGFLTARRGEPLTSDVLAATYGTSPVVLRRVLVKLQRAGLVETRRGVGGGSVLARAPEDINLREAYEAIRQGDELLPRHPSEGGGVGPIVGEYLNELYEEAEQALVARLEAVTVAQMDRVVRRRILKARRCSQDRC